MKNRSFLFALSCLLLLVTGGCKRSYNENARDSIYAFRKCILVCDTQQEKDQEAYLKCLREPIPGINTCSHQSSQEKIEQCYTDRTAAHVAACKAEYDKSRIETTKCHKVCYDDFDREVRP